MSKEIKNSDVLFYVQNNIGDVFPDQIQHSRDEIDNSDSGVVLITEGQKRGEKLIITEFENRIPKIENLIPIEKDVFQYEILKMTNFFNELIPQFPNDDKGSNTDDPGYVLDQIEINLSAEITGGFKLFLSAKGNAGIKIIFKRK